VLSIQIARAADIVVIIRREEHTGSDLGVASDRRTDRLLSTGRGTIEAMVCKQDVNRHEPIVPAPLYSLVVVAASAGGLAALTTLLADLPGGFPLPVAVVQHLDPRHDSVMAQILGRRTALRVKEAAAGDLLAPGVVFVAPANRHLLVGPRRSFELNRSERVHFLRPADSLFASAAKTCGRVIAVVLTGTGHDAAAGIIAVKAAGGAAIAQDKASSAFFGMPQAAIDTGLVDWVLPLDRIGAALVGLAARFS
jgi:two-component system chemotaxis response regulator CheB